MTDIVERLRTQHPDSLSLVLSVREAATEIERLREALQAMMDGEPGCMLLARRALRSKP